MANTKGNLDIVIVQGATFNLPLQYQDSAGDPIDLPTHTAELQIRESVESETVLLELTSSGGEIVLNSPTGTIDITIIPSVTSTIAWTTGVYDLKLFNTSDPDDIVNIIYGDVSVRQQVTR